MIMSKSVNPIVAGVVVGLGYGFLKDGYFLPFLGVLAGVYSLAYLIGRGFKDGTQQRD